MPPYDRCPRRARARRLGHGAPSRAFAEHTSRGRDTIPIAHGRSEPRPIAASIHASDPATRSRQYRQEPPYRQDRHATAIRQDDDEPYRRPRQDERMYAHRRAIQRRSRPISMTALRWRRWTMTPTTIRRARGVAAVSSTAVTLIGCAMIGTAGAYGYRTYYMLAECQPGAAGDLGGDLAEQGRVRSRRTRLASSFRIAFAITAERTRGFARRGAGRD